MFLPNAALRNRQFTYIIITLLLLLGLLSYSNMPRSEDPQFNLPITLLEVIYPGSSPLDVETLIVDPLEQQISELEDIKEINTHIKNGGARIEIKFIYGTDPDDSYDDVLAAAANIRARLPAEAQLLFFKASPTTVNILQLAVWSSEQDYRQMEIYSEQLEKRLESLPEVRKAERWGLPTQIVEVAVDAEKLRKYQLTITQLHRILSNRAENITPGFVDASERRFNLRVSGQYKSIDEVANTPLPGAGPSPLTVADVASVRFASDTPTYLAYFDRQPVVFVTVQQQPGSNIFELSEQLQQEIDNFRQTLPETIGISTVFKQEESVAKRVNGFFENLLQGMVIVALLSLLFLGWKEALIITVTVPLAFAVAIGWVDIAGFGLEQMSIVGLIIALGLLVDDAIVVTESIHRVKQHTKDIHRAAIEGASRIGWASTSGTATTILAFLPLLMLPSSSGDFMRSMPVTVSLVLTSSLLLSLSLTPLMAARLLKTEHAKWTLQNATNWLANHHYSSWIHGVIQRPWRVTVIGLLLMGILLALFPQIGVSLFPKAEKPMLLVNIYTPNNTSFAETNRIIQALAGQLSKESEVQTLAINVGNSNPRIYYNHIPNRGEPNYGQILVLLQDYSPEVVNPFIARWRDKFQHYPEAEVTIQEFQQGPVTDPPITFRIIGDDIPQLQIVARELENKMRSLSGTVNVKNTIAEPQVEVALDIDYARLALLNVDVASLDNVVKAHLTGIPAGTLKDTQGNSYPIVLQSPHQALSLLDTLYIPSTTGEMIPLAQLARPMLVEGHPEFFHYQKIRTAKVTADVAAGASVNQLTGQLQQFMQTYPLPAGVSFQVGGEEESREENFAGLSHVMLVSAVGIFALLVLQFRSLRQPLIIFTSVPYAIGGATLGLYLHGYAFSIMAFVGLISLFGIVVNNAIILVDTFNYHRRQGVNKQDAVVKASRTRFTPILLTSLTTIGGLLPLTLLGGQLWAPLGWVIIYGLGVSTLSSLIMVPIFIRLLSPERER